MEVEEEGMEVEEEAVIKKIKTNCLMIVSVEILITDICLNICYLYKDIGIQYPNVV